MKQRLFIGIPICEDVKNKIINNLTLPSNFKITSFNNLHITIFFLGDTDEKMIPQIIKNLDETINFHNSFELEISSFGQFPPKGYPKIIYVTGDKGRNELINLACEIKKILKKLDFSDDKNFTYHITVGRMKYKKDEFIKLPIMNMSYSFLIEKVILYKSDLKSDGPLYTALWEGKLKKN